MKVNKRRAGVIIGGVGVVGALAALSLGGTSALFSSAVGPQNNQITSGTMSLTENSTASQLINVAGFMPGDEKTSKYGLKYVGNDAFVGFDIKITSVAKNACSALAGDASVTPAELAGCTDTGTQPMYNGDPASGSLDMSIAPYNGNTYGPLILDSVLQAGTTCAADGAGLVACTTEKKNVLIPPGYITAGSANDLIWKDGKTDAVTVTSKLPLAAGNVFQGSKVQIDLVAKAVQAANNSGLVDTVAPGTTLPYNVYGTGNQGTLLFPKSWS